MTLNEVVGILDISREKAISLIERGVALPRTGTTAFLKATKIGSDYDISESDCDDFISKFEAEEPGRHPPAAVRRTLKVEAGHRCAICADSAPLQYHHMIDWARIKHHDPQNMLAICGTCHDKCTKGLIDYPSQVIYKARLLSISRRYAPDVVTDATKRDADLQMLKHLFEQLHTGSINAFFEKAAGDEVGHDAFIFWEGFRVVMQEATLFFYDKTLQSLFAQFYQYWGKTLDYGAWFRSIPGTSSFRFSFDIGEREQIQTQHDSFHRDLADAEAAFRLLYEYIREEFPNFNVAETDAIAWKSNVKYL